MYFDIFFAVLIVASEATAHVTAAPPPTTTHGLITIPQFSLWNTTVDGSSTWQPPWLLRAPAIQIAGEGDNDEPPERPGFTDPDASPTSTIPISASAPLASRHEGEPTETATAMATATTTAKATATRTQSRTISTEYLSQVPRGWPYTRFGLGRRKETATWRLTNGDGEIVGVVKHEVLWYPRPLWTGTTPLLEGWKPTFVVTGGVGPAVTGTGDDDGSYRVEGLDPRRKRVGC